MCESVFKVLVVGDSGVGKTAMVARYCQNKWLANYKATLGGELICECVTAEFLVRMNKKQPFVYKI